MTITIEDDPREARLRELEREVIERAIIRRQAELCPKPVSKIDGGHYETALIMERHAVDALLAACAESSTPTVTTS